MVRVPEVAREKILRAGEELKYFYYVYYIIGKNILSIRFLSVNIEYRYIIFFMALSKKR